jgi:outer membrane protein insertion porin family
VRARCGGNRWRRARQVLGTVVAMWVVAPVLSQAQAPAEAPSLAGPVVVAVLPFRVHSAKPVDYLGESLANLIHTRLEEAGDLQVIGVSDVRDRLGSDAFEETSDPGLRALARELGADYVISGSLTELAGHYSLDLRMTPAAVGLPARSRVLTAEEEDQLLASVDELADRVREQLVGGPPSEVAEVVLVGGEGISEDLQGRLSTTVGEPYDPVVVRDDLALLRADASVIRADVEVETRDDGVLVTFSLVTADRPIPAASGIDSVVSEVRIRGNRRIEADAIRARLGTREGEPYRSVQIAKDLMQINTLGFFRDVKVYTEEGQDGLIVTFEVEENPVVRQISISGNDSVEGDKVRDVLTLTTGSTLDYPLLFENRGRIEALYRAQGYYLAEVSYEIESLGEASVGIHFEVTENDKLHLEEIEFVGNEHFSDWELTEGFHTKTWHFWSYATSYFDNSGTYSEPLFHQDLRSVQNMYNEAGFIQVEVSPPEVTVEPDGISVSVEVKEGPQFRCGEIDVTGDSTVDVDALREMIQLKEGDIFNRTFLTDDVTQLTSFYQDRGFFYASVEPLSRMDDDTKVVDLVFQVRKGPLYFVRQIDISGNTTTVDPVIRREVPVVEGQLYSQRQINLSRGRVQRLGYFEEVDFRMEPTPEPEQLDMEVSVVEKPTGSLSFGAGFSSQDSFVLQGSLAQTNLFGRGYGVNLSADFSTSGASRSVYLSFTDPAFLGSEFSLSTTISNRTLKFEDFKQDQIGADVVLGHALTEDNRTRGFLRYSFSSREVNQNSNVNAASLIFRELLNNSITSSSLGVSFVADYRDDQIAPTSGYQLGATAEYAGMGFFAEFVRLEGRAAWYLGAPSWMPDRSTFVIATRAGYAIPLNTVGDWDLPETDAFDDLIIANNPEAAELKDIDQDLELPLSERYFLGGLGQFGLRGFKARSVGPRRAILRTINPLTRAAYTPVGRDNSGVCVDTPALENLGSGGNGNGKCNNLKDKKNSDFEDLKETDVIGGNKFISTSFEYRFPISEAIGLQGILFMDMGNAFAEGDNLLNVDEWRYGSGGAVQWFSPFGPLMLVLGAPLDPLENEKTLVFEFSVGGGAF